MSTEITTAMIDTYNEGIEMLAQQMQSKLIDRVRVESEPGERNSFDQIGAVRARKRTTRHGDTEYINTPHRRRWVTTDPYDVADLLDEPDMVRVLNNPGGEMGKAFLAGLNRERDFEIIAASRRTAFTGKKGETQVAFPSGQVIAHGGTGFTLAKVATAMKMFKQANAVEDDPDLTIAWTAAQEEEFLDTTEVKSHDFNTQRVLIKGAMGMDDEFYGFHYVRLEDWQDENGDTVQILPKTGTVRSCMAWIRNGILLNQPVAPNVRVIQLGSKKFSWQWFGTGDFGATRMQENHVIEIEAQEP